MPPAAAATNARVCVDIFNQFARLVVRDNGRGFDAATVRRGVGLASMNERLTALGGSLKIEPTSSGGTLLQVEVG